MDKLPDVTATKPSSRSCGESAESDEELLVVITGGSKGIGRSCVDCFARRGARVLFSFCSDAEAAAQVERAFEPAGRVQGRRLDQGDFDSVHAFAAEVELWRAGRQVDALVNNAGLGTATVSAYLSPRTKGRPGEQEEGRGSKGDATKLEAARRRAGEDVALMRVNALGPMRVTEALLPMMQPRFTNQRKQTVLFVGSVGGGSQSVFPGFRPADGMSKAALVYACNHFAARRRRPAAVPMIPGGSDRGASASGPTHDTAGAPGATVTAASDISGCVDFLCLCPGATLTDMFRASMLDKLDGAGQLENFLRTLPQGRLTLPQEVGEAVYWLCTSPAASMFHGAVIDGSAGLAVRPGVFTEFAF